MHPLPSLQVLSDFVSSTEQTGSLPNSLSEFAKNQNYDLYQISKQYDSIQNLEQSIYQYFFEQTQNLLNQDPNYAEYETKDRILALYFTLFELFNANQIYIRLSLNNGLGLIQHRAKLKGLKSRFENYIHQLVQPLLPSLLPASLQQLLISPVSEAMWLQFLSILGFWLQDTSGEHERTDVLIEKSIAASFEIWDAFNWRYTPDLMRFWLEEISKLRRNL